MEPFDTLMARCRALGVEMSEQDGALRCRAAPGVLTGELTAEIRKHKPTIMASLREAASERQAIQGVEREQEAERDPHPELGPAYRTPWGTTARSAPDALPIKWFGPP